MRSIADQLGNKIKSDLKQKDNAGEKNYSENEIEKKIAIQHLGLQGSPYFAKRVVITTLDTFVLNFYKMPVREFSKALEGGGTHFDFPRAQIYSAFVIFDEFHLFSKLGIGIEDAGSRSKSLTSVLCAIKGLCLSGVPVIVMTATIPKPMKELLVNDMREFGITVIEKVYFKGSDPEFERKRGKRRLDFGTLERSKFPEKCGRLISEGKKVLCVFNTVKSAVNAYYALKDLNPFLIHGKLPEVTRKKRTEEISRGKTMSENTPKLAVSTQVIESGVDLSFDVLITEPCPADRLMQRCGRVARDEHSYEGEVLILDNGVALDTTYMPYDPPQLYENQ